MPIDHIETELELAYQQFLARNQFDPSPLIKAAYMAGYADGFDKSRQWWTEGVERICNEVRAL
jgi:hypothetical protein